MPITDDLTTLVSIFHTPERAAGAISDLRDAGVPANAIQTLGAKDSVSSAPEQALSTLRTLNLPADDLQVLSEGLKSGGTLIVVHARHEISEKAEQVFERFHAHKIDELAGAVQSRTAAPASAGLSGEDVIPVVEESLVVGKRRVERGGVRVFSHIVETPVQEQVVLREEHARIERQVVNRPISEAEVASLHDQTIEVREMNEEAVVNKTARVVEEIRVGKSTTERTQEINETLRKTEVEVDRSEPDSLKSTPRKV